MAIAVVRVVVLVVLAALLPTVASARAGTPPASALTAAPDRPRALTITPHTPIRGERVRVAGRLPTRGVRPVRLQRQARAGWTTVARARTARDGTYRLSTRASWPASARLRVASASYRTPTRVVRTQPQRTIARTPATGRVGLSTSIAARAFPARPGRAMVLERRSPSGWRGVATATQDRTGRAAFDVEPATPGTERYRVVARPHAGAGAATSADALLRVAPDEVVIDERVVVLSFAEAAALRDPVKNTFLPQPERLVFDNLAAPPSLHRLRPGHVLSVPPCTAMRWGALLEVTGKEVGPLETTLELRLASMADVVLDVPDAQSTIRLHPVGPARVTRTNTGVRALPARPGDAVGATRFALDVDSMTTDGRWGARTVGQMSISPEVGLVYDMDDGVLDRYEVTLGARVDDRLRVTKRRRGIGDQASRGTEGLAAVETTYVGLIGRLPVWITHLSTIGLSQVRTDGLDTHPEAVVDVRRTGEAVASFGSDEVGVRPTFVGSEPTTTTEVVHTGDGAAYVSVGSNARLHLNGAYVGSYGSGSAISWGVNVFESGCSQQRWQLTGLNAGHLAMWTTLVGEGRGGWLLWDHLPEQIDYSDTCPPARAPAEIVTERLPDVLVAEEYASALEVADHRAGAWDLVAGDLPSGLSLSDGGRIAGTYVGREVERTIEVSFTDVDGLVVSAPVIIRTVSSRSGSRWSTIDGGPTTCGIRTDGSGWCWGENSRGQAGVGDFEPRPAPVRLDGEWVSISAGRTSCGIRTDGTGWCWGSNVHGQVGDGATIDRSSPVQVPGRWLEIRPGTSTCRAEDSSSDIPPPCTATPSCGVQVDGSGWCWGVRTMGDASGGWHPPITSPYRVAGDWRTLRPGGSECGIRSDETLWCQERADQQVDGSPGASSMRQVGERRWRSGAGPTTGYYPGLCGILSAGAGFCADSEHDEAAPVLGPLEQLTVSTFGAYSSTSCAVRVDRAGVCWGANRYGQVGDGSTSLDDPPHTLDGSWRSLQTGYRTCGVQTDDTAWCWGFNGYGGVGDGTTHGHASPVRIPGSWSQLDDSCGIRTDGTAWCWGTSGLGPVATGETDFRTTPIQVP